MRNFFTVDCTQLIKTYIGHMFGYMNLVTWQPIIKLLEVTYRLCIDKSYKNFGIG